MTESEYDVTIAIPTRDGGELLDRVFAAIDRQATAKRVERLALDSGSTDNTVARLEDNGFRVLETDRETFDWGEARDRLFEESRGAIVVSLSQDAVPATEVWLENLVRPLSDSGIGASCGSSVPDADRSFPQFAWERNGYFYFTREIAKFVRRYGKGLSFANTAVPKRVWRDLRIHPQATGEDFQFQTKLHDASLQIAFPDDAPVYHHHNYSIKALYRRCRNEGLALREMGCPYSEWDLLCDLATPGKYVQWLRELRRGSLTSAAAVLFPVVRPAAVYSGSRFGRRYVWY